jgi:two-component system, OmpR family, phosphate regulon sensor histidine kinase PhoR
MENNGAEIWRQRPRRNWLLITVIMAIAAVAILYGYLWASVGFMLSALLLALFLYPAERNFEATSSAMSGSASPPVPLHDPVSDLCAALSAIDIPLYLIDAAENIVFLNQSAQMAFGEINAKTHISAQLRSPSILDCVRETVATGNINAVEFTERHPSTRVFSVSVAPVAELAATSAFNKERAKYYILSFRDISEARRIDRMRSDFVANASHELRTPLASLQGFIETLQGPAKNDQKASERFLIIMLEQVQRMNRLVDDLLSLSRLELKAHIAPSDKVELGPLLGHVRDSLGPLAQDLGVEIVLQLPEAPVFVAGDRDELIQVFENLIQNACKYGQEGKRVEVSLRAASGHGPEVSVCDFGPGIAEEHLPRLTERFYRVNVEASRSKKGTGLGLAIVKHILTRHRARLLVKSELGKGSVFTVRF